MGTLREAREARRARVVAAREKARLMVERVRAAREVRAQKEREEEALGVAVPVVVCVESEEMPVAQGVVDLVGTREAVRMLMAIGWGVGKIAEACGCSRQWVHQVRADFRAIEGDGGEVERLMRTRVVPRAVENVVEMLEDEGLREKRPGLIYEMSKDALQVVPFQKVVSSAGSSEGSKVVVQVMALPGVNLQVNADAKKIEE